MASVTMATSFLGGGATFSPATSRRSFVITNSVKPNTVNVTCENKQEGGNNGRREAMFAAVAATICSVAGMAVANEPKRGSPEAKKVYAPICVSNPTARICKN